MTKQINQKKWMKPFLWVASGVFFVGLMLALTIYPELMWLAAIVGVVLMVALAGLFMEYRKELTSRSAAFGLNSIMTALLVISIIGVLNFLSNRHHSQWDFTANKIHTLSDQTVKLIKGLQKPVKAVFFSKVAQREQVRPMLENYRALNPTKFEIEFTDPDKEPARAKQANITKYGTLQLLVGERDTKVEELTEEKITNSLIKITKEKSQLLCALTGHGEKNFNGQDADGYQTVKQALGNQAYELKEINLVTEGKVPDSCTALAIVGPTKAFFPQELKILSDYLDNGGRAVVALDIDPKGSEWAKDLIPVLATWHVKPQSAMIVDPLSRMLNIDPSVAILATFSKDNPITKDFQGNVYFPFSRPIDVVPGAPAGLNVQWLAQSTPKSWGVTNMKELATGQVTIKEGQDKAGPLNTAVAVEGKQKDSKAPRSTRLVVFGTSFFATNHFSRLAGNLDFFMNAASWVMEDESLISIRAKESGPGRVELSQKQGVLIFWLTVIITPLIVASTGIGIWAFRRRL